MVYCIMMGYKLWYILVIQPLFPVLRYTTIDTLSWDTTWDIFRLMVETTFIHIACITSISQYTIVI